MPLKGMAAAVMPAGGWVPAAGVVRAETGHPAVHGERLAHHTAHSSHMLHRAQVAGTVDSAHAVPLPPCHGPSGRGAADTAPSSTGDNAGLHKTPSTPKCSACDACAAATPLPARPPRVDPPHAGPANFLPLARIPVHFLTDVPDRPPRHRLA